MTSPYVPSQYRPLGTTGRSAKELAGFVRVINQGGQKGTTADELVPYPAAMIALHVPGFVDPPPATITTAFDADTGELTPAVRFWYDAGLYRSVRIQARVMLGNPGESYALRWWNPHASGANKWTPIGVGTDVVLDAGFAGDIVGASLTLPYNFRLLGAIRFGFFKIAGAGSTPAIFGNVFAVFDYRPAAPVTGVGYCAAFPTAVFCEDCTQYDISADATSDFRAQNNPDGDYPPPSDALWAYVSNTSVLTAEVIEDTDGRYIRLSRGTSNANGVIQTRYLGTGALATGFRLTFRLRLNKTIASTEDLPTSLGSFGLQIGNDSRVMGLSWAYSGFYLTGYYTALNVDSYGGPTFAADDHAIELSAFRDFEITVEPTSAAVTETVGHNTDGSHDSGTAAALTDGDNTHVVVRASDADGVLQTLIDVVLADEWMAGTGTGISRQPAVTLYPGGSPSGWSADYMPGRIDVL